MPSTLSTRVRRALPRPRVTRRRLIAGGVVLLVLLGVVAWKVWPRPAAYRTTSQMIRVLTGPGGNVPINLDSTFYLPKIASAAHPVPAVLLAHGFGGTKDSVATQAKDLADRGYAVLAWTAQGFGRSGGQINLDSPDWEVRDAQRLIDWLAAQPDVLKDGPGDPRVGVVGGSYGGGLALMLAAYDHRVDAIVPMITWNDLASAFLPDATGAGPADGVFKKAWAGLFFGSSGGGGAGGGGGALGAATGSGSGSGSVPAAAGGGLAAPPNPACGRFADAVCQAYLSIASTGRATPAAVALLRQSSPATVIDRIKAPTLLIQGEADSLFGLDQADANARALAANHVPVRLAWYTGGHDGGAGPQSDQDRLNTLTYQWLDHYLKHTGPVPADTFTYSQIAGLNATDRGLIATAYSVPGYPGLSGDATTTIDVAGPPQPIANPPNDTPAGISSLPGLGAGGLSSLTSGTTTEVPGQHADFVSAPLKSTIAVVGAPTVGIRAASPTGEAVLFVKLYDYDPASGLTLPDGLVAPVRLTGLPTSIAQAQPVTVTLPGIVYRFQAGHRLVITASTSDQAYATPPAPTVYTVAVGGAGVPGAPAVGGVPTVAAVGLPTVRATVIAPPNLVWRWILVGLAVLLAIGLIVAIAVGRRRARRGDRTVHAGYADTPLVVSGLRKEYGDGFVAVSRVDFSVGRGQVVGLLGPNGAGKTTTLRVLMGLTSPTAGDVYVFGHPLAPGSPVLSRVGALVEGPGFMPHLSGLTNLMLYWRSTGRPLADAHLDEALDIAGLGDAIHRRVKTYSHGMRQRLAIAQAMLGLPELLVLDEPTDGLDPPQIAEMRKVLRRYATGGRAVLVSSHLLAEVEQTCTHVVVMHKGEKVADGPVDDIVGDSPTVQFDVSDAEVAGAVLTRMAGVRSVAREGSRGLVVDIDGTPRADVVAALVRAGVGVDRVQPRRRLEDAFLSLVGGDGAGTALGGAGSDADADTGAGGGGSGADSGAAGRPAEVTTGGGR